MPAPADAALTPLDLRKLLADPNTVLPALIYIRVHRRLELLPDLCDWWQRWEQEARLLNGLAAAAGDWQQPTGEQSARAEQLDSWQSSLIRTLVWLGQAAEIVLNAARWKGVTILGKAHRKAVAGLLLQPAYLSALVAAVEWGMVPATWLSTALAEQGVLLERQPAGEWASRRGARRTSLAAGS
jgi:hypothetical protein